MSRRAGGRTGHEPVTGFDGAGPRLREDSGPLVADRGTGREAATGPVRSAPTGPVRSAPTGPMTATASLPEVPAGRRADAEHHADPDRRAGGGRSGATATSRSRHRVAWRNGADVDQELWPIEAFGGVSDEQFWDDLAADRPLATTARTAQADSGPSRRPAEAYPPLRPAAGDRTVVPPVVQAVQAAAPVVQVVQAVAAPAAIPTQPYPVVSRPPQTATKPVRAAHQPAESRGRRSAEAGGPGPDEDPLTSPAYSLRAKGAVDGHSGQATSRSKDMTREQYEQYETALSKEMQAFMIGRATEARPDPLRPDPLRPDLLRPDQLRPDPLRSGAHRADPLRSNGHRPGSSAPAGTTGALAYQPGSGSAGRHAAIAAYAYPGQSHGQPSRSVNTPPYGSKMNGYLHPVSPAGDPGRSYGSRGYSWAGGNGVSGGNSGPRHAYPPVNGYHGAYPPVNGYHGPYDAWRNDRR